MIFHFQLIRRPLPISGVACARGAELTPALHRVLIKIRFVVSHKSHTHFLTSPFAANRVRHVTSICDAHRLGEGPALSSSGVIAAV